jgi:hypothetical protein
MSEGDTQDLGAAGRQAMAQHPGLRVIEFDWNGARHVLKRMQAKPRARFKQTLLRGLCRIFFPGHVLGGALFTGDGLFEANRIRRLAKAGMHVPEIELEMPEAMVYSHCGMNLRNHLKQQLPAERERILLRAVHDLAMFHQAGCWHGGAQLRNVLVQGGPGDEHFCRIDFEEDFEGQFSLPILQVYDLCLFLIDAMRQANDEAGATNLGARLVAEYRALHWSTDHQAIWRRLAYIATPIGWLAPLLRWINHSGSNRVLLLSRLLDKALTVMANRSPES